ncbi:MAG TPA: hypothetical protein VEU11_18880 [Terriglobales bacterium]|nr:hypothetical protein [Terriglobales bacterium]
MEADFPLGVQEMKKNTPLAPDSRRVPLKMKYDLGQTLLLAAKRQQSYVPGEFGAKAAQAGFSDQISDTGQCGLFLCPPALLHLKLWMNGEYSIQVCKLRQV